ncbi:MAG: peptide chain release factor N(5)-glutamine methyltransferase [Bacilli bacterium]|nr:peptide chain release factor N(5)-glutamine methyltransferase [Bacilli bacterium]
MKMEYVIYIKKYLPKSEWDNAIKKLEDGISPQYIVGNVNFYGNIINVDDRVLIPRFETELLVEKTISYIKNKFKKQISILDIGTGSGCISIALKKETNCLITASDISNNALEVAKENAKLNNVDIKFVQSDIFSNIYDKFDVIISNPPYIAYNEKVEDIVKNNEPEIALYADNNGLYFYDRILKDCKNYLNSNFLIAFEIGYKQSIDIVSMAYKYLGDNIVVNVEKDYSDKDRFVFIYKDM